MAKDELSGKYTKLVMHQLGFTDSEIEELISNY
jgi:hypothetical protein